VPQPTTPPRAHVNDNKANLNEIRNKNYKRINTESNKREEDEGHNEL
jgi:hypothetical protein